MPDKNRLCALVFDFDGTLAELVLDFTELKRGLADLAGLYLEMRPEPPQSPPALEWVELLGARIGRESPQKAREFAARAADFIQKSEIEAAGRGRLFEFTRPLLERLRGQGTRTAIITRNCRAAVLQVFPDALAHCPVLLAREDAARVKPDPAHLTQALNLLGCSPEAALVVGDHPLDLETGRRAGSLCAGVTTGRVSLGELRARKPDYAEQDAWALYEKLQAEGLLS